LSLLKNEQVLIALFQVDCSNGMNNSSNENFAIISNEMNNPGDGCLQKLFSAEMNNQSVGWSGDSFPIFCWLEPTLYGVLKVEKEMDRFQNYQNYLGDSFGTTKTTSAR
jgi:hypothetical protein